MRKTKLILHVIVCCLWVGYFSMSPLIALGEESREVQQIEAYFPNTVGMTWTYTGTVANKVLKVKTYTNIATVEDIIQVDGVPAIIFSETNQGNKGPSKSYFSMGEMGIVYHGGEPPSDFENQLIPYSVIPFPIRFQQKFIQLEKKDVDFGHDIDQDGINERADVSASVVAESYETIAVPAGVYKNALKLRGKMVITLKLSDSQVSQQVEIIDRTTTWLVPGIGMVKGIESIEFPGVGEVSGTTSVTTELLTKFSEKPSSNQ